MKCLAILFDSIIAARHNGFQKSDTHKTDLDPAHFECDVNELDPDYVLSCRVCTSRSIRGVCLPPLCTRAERRAVDYRA